MDRWQGRVAVVTGAGAGIGRALVTTLVEKGMIVAGLDVVDTRLQSLAKELANKKGKFHQLKADLINVESTLKAFSWVEDNLGGVDLFINNAAVLPKIEPLIGYTMGTTVYTEAKKRCSKLIGCGWFADCNKNETDQLRKVFDINLLALTICSREAIKSMKRHKIKDGNIINISSIASQLSTPPAGYVAYSASKKAVITISEGIRNELAMENSNIRIMTICPGLTGSTDIFASVGAIIPENKPRLHPQNVVDAIIFCLQLPQEVQVTELHIRPLKENLSEFKVIDSEIR